MLTEIVVVPAAACEAKAADKATSPSRNTIRRKSLLPSLKTAPARPEFPTQPRANQAFRHFHIKRGRVALQRPGVRLAARPALFGAIGVVGRAKGLAVARW